MNLGQSHRQNKSKGKTSKDKKAIKYKSSTKSQKNIANKKVSQLKQVTKDKLLVNNKELKFQYQFSQTAILSKQKHLQYIYQAAASKNKVIYHDSMKFRGLIYKIGEFVQLCDIKEKQKNVGRLNKIIRVPEPLQKLPFLEISWCLKKKDLPEELIYKHGQYISQAEVFPSEHISYIYPDSIIGKCMILSFSQYSQLQSAYQYYYFSRSSFNIKTFELNPDPKEWTKACFCNKPINPDVVYISCQQCDKWFHADCANLKSLQEDYLCNSCKNNRQITQITYEQGNQ